MKILLALGANLPSIWGNPAKTLTKAIGRLSECIGTEVEFRRFYVAPAVPAGCGPDFVNTVVRLETGEAPENVLGICHKIENEARRVRDNRWAPRTLDIDLIACDQEIRPDLAGFQTWRTLPMGEQMRQAPDTLILPHPRMQDRAFVLVPMNDVAPDWRHPVLGQTTAEMLAALPEAERLAIRPYENP